MKHIKLKMWLIGNVVLFKVLGQTGIERGILDWKCKETGLTIKSVNSPSLFFTSGEIHVQGVCKEDDNLIAYTSCGGDTSEFYGKPIEEALDFYNDIKRTVELFNAEFGGLCNDEITTEIIG